MEGEEQALLTEISLKDDIEQPEKALKDCLRMIKEKSRKLLIQKIQIQITEAEKKKDYNTLKKLQVEQLRIIQNKGSSQD